MDDTCKDRHVIKCGIVRSFGVNFHVSYCLSGTACSERAIFFGELEAICKKSKYRHVMSCHLCDLFALVSVCKADITRECILSIRSLFQASFRNMIIPPAFA